MKIFVLSNLWPPFPGGAERFVFNVADQMAKRGHSIVVETSYFKAKDSPGIKVAFHDIGVRSQSEMRHVDGWSIIKADIEATDPDVILTHHFFAREFEAELMATGRRIIQIVHNGARMEGAALAIFNSEYTRYQSNPKPQDLTIIPPAFDDVFVGEKMWLASNTECIGFVKPIQHKGVDFFYRIAGEMRERKFLVLRGEWILIEDIRPMPNVEFVETVEDIREFYRRCRIVLVPSLHEDAGTVPQEAALNGIPCISSNIMGLNETNAAGIRLNVGEVGPWIEEIRRLDDPVYYHDVSVRERFGIEAFQWKNKFDALDEWIRR